MKTTHYDILGVPHDATADQIRAAYRERRGALHPDREGGDHEAMAALNAAHTVLSDPVQRAAYDEALPNVERDAHQHAEHVLSESLKQESDPIEHATEKVRSNLAEIAMARQLREKAVARLRKHLKNVRFKGAGKNIASSLAERKIEAIEAEAEGIDHIEAVLQRTLELLADYDYEPPEQPSPPSMSSLDAAFHALRSAAGSGTSFFHRF